MLHSLLGKHGTAKWWLSFSSVVFPCSFSNSPLLSLARASSSRGVTTQKAKATTADYRATSRKLLKRWWLTHGRLRYAGTLSWALWYSLHSVYFTQLIFLCWVGEWSGSSSTGICNGGCTASLPPSCSCFLCMCCYSGCPSSRSQRICSLSSSGFLGSSPFCFAQRWGREYSLFARLRMRLLFSGCFHLPSRAVTLMYLETVCQARCPFRCLVAMMMKHCWSADRARMWKTEWGRQVTLKGTTSWDSRASRGRW